MDASGQTQRAVKQAPGRATHESRPRRRAAVSSSWRTAARASQGCPALNTAARPQAKCRKGREGTAARLPNLPHGNKYTLSCNRGVGVVASALGGLRPHCIQSVRARAQHRLCHREPAASSSTELFM